MKLSRSERYYLGLIEIVWRSPREIARLSGGSPRSAGGIGKVLTGLLSKGAAEKHPTVHVFRATDRGRAALREVGG